MLVDELNLGEQGREVGRGGSDEAGQGAVHRRGAAVVIGVFGGADAGEGGGAEGLSYSRSAGFFPASEAGA